MTLTEALKSLIDAKGLTILKSPMAINILSDYNAFSEHPSSKNILKNFIVEGYLEKIAFFYDNQLPIGDAPQFYLSELHQKLGFRQDVSIYVINSIMNALGYGTPLSSGIQEEGSTPDENKTDLPEEITEELNGGKHMEFKGISLCGSKERVAQALVKMGYKEVDRGDDGVLITGKFAGKDACQILVSSSPHTGQVYSVVVFTPASLNWWGIKADYENIKSMLQKKYGAPSSRTEFFGSPYEEGDGYELTAFSTGNAFFVTKYETAVGEISVCITSDAKLLISYIDKKNGEDHNVAEGLAAEDDL